MRWTGACVPRHRSVLILLALALIAFAMSTPTAAASCTNRPAEGVAVLAQQPLPHCAAANQMSFDPPPVVLVSAAGHGSIACWKSVSSG